MNRKQKNMLLRILLSAAMLGILHFLPVQGYWRLALYILPYLVVGYDILWGAVTGLCSGQWMDENFLMSLATVGAFVLGAVETGDYFEAVAVMLFFQVGELFQSYAVGKSRRNIAKLMDIRPQRARVEQAGRWQEQDPEAVPVGSVIRVEPGERVPLDGVILSGMSSLDTAALTGESIPRDVIPGDMCCSGCINMTGVLTLRTTKVYAESTVARILEMVENAGASKANPERFISRFARIYTPAVCACAVILAIVPPLWDGAWLVWLYRALAFLVSSCPCALVISIPLTFFAGIGGAGKAGVLIKGASYLELMGKVKTVVFDKTGTLTQGSFGIFGIYPQKMDSQQLLYYAAMAELFSSHPISACLRDACRQPLQEQRVSQLQEVSGYGVTAQVDGVTVAVGNHRWMAKQKIDFTPCPEVGTVVYVAVDGAYAGCILVGDQLKPHSQTAVKALRKAGVQQIVMLTGDHPAAADQVAKQLELDGVYSQLLPDGKVEKLQYLLEKKPKGSTLIYVGDGINDAPVLTLADVGVAMGVMGTDAALEAADVVLMDDNLQKIPRTITFAGRCMRIVYENIFGSIFIKLLCLLLVALGFAGMGLAVFADVGVMVLSVLNASRALVACKT